MKRNYISPSTQIMPISVENHILDMSTNGSITIDDDQTVDTELVKGENPFSHNVWDDDWSAK